MVSKLKCSKWYLNTCKWEPNKDQWSKLLSSIANDERQRVERFVYKDDAKQALVSRALIRHYTSTALNLPSNEVQLIRTHHGRPVLDIETLPQRKVLDFNVSHSGKYCALVGIDSTDPFSENKCSIGIDVLKIVSKKTKPELDRFLSLMKRREFLPKEWDIVERAQNDRQRCVNFSRLWCLKESFIKAEGSGLSFGLSRICFSIKTELPCIISDNCSKSITDTSVEIDGHHTSNWLFEESNIDADHLVTIGVCSENISEITPVILKQEFQEIPIDFLVAKLTPMHVLDNDEAWHLFDSKLNRTR